MAHDVFISYSSKDKPIADAVCANIESVGIRCWIAPRDISPGEDWPTAITKAISQSRVMVLVFSASSNSSEDVGRELMLAAYGKLVIIPFKIENVEPEPGKQYYLARTHWLDAINPPTQEQIRILIRTVQSFIPVVTDEDRGQSVAAFPHANQNEVRSPQRFLPKPTPIKKLSWVRYLWIPASLVLLILLSWIGLPYITHTPSGSFETQTTSATISTTTPPKTVELSPTPLTDILSPMTPAPLNWDVIISDSFSSNENGWPNWSNSNDGCSVSSMNIQSGVLLWNIEALDRNSCGYVYNPALPSVSDFDASYDMKRMSGIGEADFGIGFRIINADNYYTFFINDTTQSFTIRRILNNSWSTLADWKYNSAIISNEYNHLAVSARGSTFTFYINDMLAYTMNDSGIASGYIGVVAEVTNGGNISVTYDNFVLHGIK